MKQEKFSHKAIEITDVVEKRSFALLRLIGYTLLLFSLIDYLAIVIPPRLTDPAWEFQTISRMVDQVWSPLLGLTFIFLYRQTTIISFRDLSILKIFSWLSLLIGIFYLLMLPLGINNSLTLYKNVNTQFTNQQGQQQEQIQQFKTKLDAANSPQELNNLARALNVPNNPAINKSPQELKAKISEQVQTLAKNALITAKVTNAQQIKNLIKDSIRINLGAIISGICFIYFWNLTRSN